MSPNGPRKPAAYVCHLLPGSSLSSGGHRYYIDGNYVLVQVDELECWNIVTNLQHQDPFPPGSVAEVPSGLPYVKIGDLWVLDPIPAPTLVIVTEQVLDNPEYWLNSLKKSLKSSSQVNTAVTKGHLAKGVVREVEKVFATSNNTLLAFSVNGNFVKETSFEDLFLVNLVQRSQGTFQPTIALRVSL
ncbi:hypothetical protein V8D89_002606 [Ganoderma adspersum]